MDRSSQQAALNAETGRHLARFPADPTSRASYVLCNPVENLLCNIPSFSTQTVNTQRKITHNRGQGHYEGGWPKEIDFGESQEISRYRRRMDKDPQFCSAVKVLCDQAAQFLDQNLAVDVFRSNFEDVLTLSDTRQLSFASTQAVFKDSVVRRPESTVHGNAATNSQDRVESATVLPPQFNPLHRRQVSRIAWHPDGCSKFVASYGAHEFLQRRLNRQVSLGRKAVNGPSLIRADTQTALRSSTANGPGAQSSEGAMSSYVWSVDNSNEPLQELVGPQCALTSCQYNVKNPDTILCGAFDGRVLFYDTRASKNYAGISLLEKSHGAAVSDAVWIQSKTGSDFCSASMDGKIMWWDNRNMAAPLDAYSVSTPTTYGSQVLEARTSEEPEQKSDKDVFAASERPLGLTALEWQLEAGPAKFLCGTEMGTGLMIQRKAKRPTEVSMWFGDQAHGGRDQHLGPIIGIKRNYAHPKCFLTVGPWSVKLWLEDFRIPIMQTTYQAAMLRAAGWSPARPGVFFACRSDGLIDFYDYFARTNEVAFSHKVSDYALTCGVISGNSRLCAVGDEIGNIHVLKLSGSLAVPPSSAEKTLVGAMLDRELRREKNIETLRKHATPSAAASSEGENSGHAQQQQQRASFGRMTNKLGLIDEEGFDKLEDSWLAHMNVDVSRKDTTFAQVSS